MAGGDIEEDDLVGVGIAVLLCQLNRVADFPDADKIDALDDLAIAHVKAWNDAFCEHDHASFASASASSRDSVPS